MTTPSIVDVDQSIKPTSTPITRSPREGRQPLPSELTGTDYGSRGTDYGGLQPLSPAMHADTFLTTVTGEQRPPNAQGDRTQRSTRRSEVKRLQQDTGRFTSYPDPTSGVHTNHPQKYTGHRNTRCTQQTGTQIDQSSRSQRNQQGQEPQTGPVQVTKVQQEIPAQYGSTTHFGTVPVDSTYLSTPSNRPLGFSPVGHYSPQSHQGEFRHIQPQLREQHGYPRSDFQVHESGATQPGPHQLRRPSNAGSSIPVDLSGSSARSNPTQASQSRTIPNRPNSPGHVQFHGPQATQGFQHRFSQMPEDELGSLKAHLDELHLQVNHLHHKNDCLQNEIAEIHHQHQSSAQAPDVIKSSPCYPKANEYPTFDGSINSDHHEWVDKMDNFIIACNIPDGEVISHFPTILKDVANSWYQNAFPNLHGQNWGQWKGHILAQFDSPAWRSNMRQKYEKFYFSAGYPKDPLDFISKYL